MRALVYGGPERIGLEAFPDPEPRNDEALVRIAAAGICGSDLHAYLGHDERRPPPLILGHEAAGVALGGVHAGRLVAINPQVVCGVCPPCRDGRTNLCPERQIISIAPRHGAFAELVAMPDANLVPLPDGFDPRKGALAEPLACGWHAVGRAELTLARPLVASSALVLGGGTIGLGAALVLAARGTGSITIAEPRADRRARLAGTGPFDIVDSADATLEPGNVDLVIDAHGDAATRAAACRLVRGGGTVVHVGLGGAAGGIEARRLTLHDIAFLGSYTYTATEFRETVAAIVAGRLGPLDWIEERPLEAGAGAFAELAAGRVATPKVILRP